VRIVKINGLSPVILIIVSGFAVAAATFD